MLRGRSTLVNPTLPTPLVPRATEWQIDVTLYFSYVRTGRNQAVSWRSFRSIDGSVEGSRGQPAEVALMEQNNGDFFADLLPNKTVLIYHERTDGFSQGMAIGRGGTRSRDKRPGSRLNSRSEPPTELSHRHAETLRRRVPTTPSARTELPVISDWTNPRRVKPPGVPHLHAAHREGEDSSIPQPVIETTLQPNSNSCSPCRSISRAVAVSIPPGARCLASSKGLAITKRKTSRTDWNHVERRSVQAELGGADRELPLPPFRRFPGRSGLTLPVGLSIVPNDLRPAPLAGRIRVARMRPISPTHFPSEIQSSRFLALIDTLTLSAKRLTETQSRQRSLTTALWMRTEEAIFHFQPFLSKTHFALLT